MPQYCTIAEAWGNEFNTQINNLLDPRLKSMNHDNGTQLIDEHDSEASVINRYDQLKNTTEGLDQELPTNLGDDLDIHDKYLNHVINCSICTHKIGNLTNRYDRYQKVEGVTQPFEFTIKLPTNTSEIIVFIAIGLAIIYIIEKLGK
jgi:hypothetical protein